MFATEKELRKSFINFIEGCLQLDADLRWTPQQAIQHPFIQQTPFTGTFIPPPRVRERAHTISAIPHTISHAPSPALWSAQSSQQRPPLSYHFGVSPPSRVEPMMHHAPPYPVSLGTSPSTRYSYNQVYL